MITHFKKPEELTNKEFKTIYQLILKGNEVDANTLQHRLTRAALVCFAIIDSKIIAIAVIKRPSKKYRDSIFTKAQIIDKSNQYKYELGYVFTETDYRGKKISSKLCNQLCDIFLAHNVFATTRSKNKPMQKILVKNHFLPTGVPFHNRKNTDELILFVKYKFDIGFFKQKIVK